MPTPASTTWTYVPTSFRRLPKLDMVKIELGDAYYRTGIKSIAWSHQDGTGGSDVSHAGYSVFEIQLPIYKYGSDFTGPIDFLRSRTANSFETFNFYDPLVEPVAANWDGVNTSGLHLVKYLDPLPKYSAETKQLITIARLKFYEVQS